MFWSHTSALVTHSSPTSGERAASEGQNTAVQNPNNKVRSNPLFPLTRLTSGTKSAPCVMLVLGGTVPCVLLSYINLFI